MTSTIHESHTANTSQPYDGGKLASQDRSTSGIDANTNPDPSTHSVGLTGGGTSKSGIGSEQTGSRDQNNGIRDGRRSTNGTFEPAEEEGGAARGSGAGAVGEESAPSKGSGAEPEGGYPEQKHAGKLTGPGPEYAKIHGATIGDRIQGVKEEIKGTIKHDPELKKLGKERMTGELKRKQFEEDRNIDPFKNAGEEKEGDAQSEPKKTRTEKTDEPGLTEHPQAHPTEKGREEQAGSVQPEVAP